MGKKVAVLAGVLIAALVVGSFAYQGFGFGLGAGGKRSSKTSTGPGCSTGPYGFADAKLGTSSLVVTLTNRGNGSANPDIFMVSLGASQRNAVNLTAPTSVSFFQQSIGTNQSSALEFLLRPKWIVAPGSYEVRFEALSESGILYGCSLPLRSSGETEIQMVNASLASDGNKTASLNFTITNASDGLLTGGVVCYAEQPDCPGPSSTRFDPVPAHSSATVHAKFDMTGLNIKGAVLFTLVLDIGVVYLFPVSGNSNQ